MTATPDAAQLAAVPHQAPGIDSRLIDGEAVLVHRGQRMVRVLNSAGARIWELADGARTVGEIAAVLADEFAIDLSRAEADAAVFCAELVTRGLLTLNSQRVSLDRLSEHSI